MSAVRKLIPIERARTLEQLIDEAGAVNAEISAKKKTYDALREKIATLMPIEVAEDGSFAAANQIGEEYQAENAYQVEKVIDSRLLLGELGIDQFLQLVKVQIGLAEAVVAPDLLSKVMGVKYKDKPTLTITKRKSSV